MLHKKTCNIEDNKFGSHTKCGKSHWIPTLLENLTYDTIAYIYVTKFWTISHYFAETLRRIELCNRVIRHMYSEIHENFSTSVLL